MGFLIKNYFAVLLREKGIEVAWSNVLCILFFLGTGTVDAQVYYFGSFNLSSVQGEAFLSDVKARNTYALGIGGRYALPVPKSALRVEGSYSRKGFDYTIAGNEHGLNYDYITLNALYAYKFLSFASLEAGFELSYLLYAEAQTNRPTVSVRSQYQDWDFGPSVGVNVLEGKSVSFFARYTWGLLPQLKTDTVSDLGELQSIEAIHNRLFQIGIRIHFFEPEYEDD